MRLSVAAFVFCALVAFSEAFLVPYLEGTGDADNKHAPLVQKRKGGGGGRGGFSNGGFSSGGLGSSGSSGFGSGSFGGSGGGRGSSSSGGKGGSGFTGGIGGSRGSSSGRGKTSNAYLSGQTMPNGISPVLLLGGAALAGGGAGALGGAALADYGAPWAHTPSAHAYRHLDTCNFHNSTSGQDMSLAVTCLCVEHALCGCDKACPAATAWEDKGKVVDVAGVKTLVVNGTLDDAALARMKASEGHRVGAVFGGSVLALVLIWGVFFSL